MELYTVDSIGDGVARLLLRRDESIVVSVPSHELPGVREGDIISAEIEAGRVVRFVLEEAETAAAKERIEAKLAKLKKRSER